MSYDNTPRSGLEQLKLLEEAYSGQLAANGTFAESWPREDQQYEKFKAFLAMVIVPSISKEAFWGAPSADQFHSILEATLPKQMRNEDRGNSLKIEWEGGQYGIGTEFDKTEYNQLEAPEVTAVLVGHSQMMSEVCDAPLPKNNAVLEKLYIIETGHASGPQSVTMRELRGECPLVMDGPSSKTSLRKLATSDVSTCTDPFDVADFLDLEENSDPDASDCVKAGDENAFPIQPEFSA